MKPRSGLYMTDPPSRELHLTRPPSVPPLGAVDRQRWSDYIERNYPHTQVVSVIARENEIEEWFERYLSVDYVWEAGFTFAVFHFKDPKYAAIFKLQFG